MRTKWCVSTSTWQFWHDIDWLTGRQKLQTRQKEKHLPRRTNRRIYKKSNKNEIVKYVQRWWNFSKKNVITYPSCFPTRNEIIVTFLKIEHLISHTRMAGFRPSICCMKALRRTARMTTVVSRCPRFSRGDGESRRRSHPVSSRLLLGAGSLGLALLAADHVFNGRLPTYLSTNNWIGV